MEGTKGRAWERVLGHRIASWCHLDSAEQGQTGGVGGTVKGKQSSQSLYGIAVTPLPGWERLLLVADTLPPRGDDSPCR